MARLSRLVRGAGASAIALAAASPLLAACLLGDLDGLTGGAPTTDAGTLPEAAVTAEEASAGPVDAGSDSGPVDAGSDAGAPAVKVVQFVGSSGASRVSFPRPTAAGNLLVALRPDPAPPSGTVWSAALSSNGVDTVFYWPNNPGGLQQFTIPSGGNSDVVLVELSGTPPSVTVLGHADTGAKGDGVSALFATLGDPVPAGTLLFAFLDTNTATAAAMPPFGARWTALGTDGNNNFAWHRVAGDEKPSTGVTFSPSTPASFLLVALGAP